MSGQEMLQIQVENKQKTISRLRITDYIGQD